MTLEEAYYQLKAACEQAPAAIQNPAPRDVLLSQLFDARDVINKAFDDALEAAGAHKPW